MRVVRLPGETDLAGWRDAARRLRLEGVAPESVFWTVGADLLEGQEPPATAAGEATPFGVPRAFMELAQEVVLHRSAERFGLLYRLLWRLQSEPRLLEAASDIDVAAARDMAKAVSRASHKMKAFVRFRRLPGIEPETCVAWFEPAHRVVERTAPFFVRRFANMRFSILTPEVGVHWDGEALAWSPGADRSQAPGEDALEAFWRTYYASIFNPARLKTRAMQAEMPKRYWCNLPEAGLIPALIEQAQTRSEAMIRSGPSEPRKRTAAGAAARVVREAAARTGDEAVPASLRQVAEAIQGCRRCDLWRDATQGVAGEGPPEAPMMLVGEQPGDQEDLAGRPFVGPAGAVLDRALAEAGVDRTQAYVTNAVKHFKHEPRGKRRLHKTPDREEVAACRWWLDHERRLLRPRVIVAMGGTAVLSVFGKPMPIMKNRGQAFQLEDQAQGFVTVHPSFLLRIPDAAAKQAAYADFVADLRAAHALLGGDRP